MSDGHGGYRQPSHPAPVSNPGRDSARTDGRPRQMDITGGSYGSAQDFRQQQQAAPLSAKPGQPGGQAAPAQPAIVGLGAPSQQPDVPVTAGAAAGAGPGPEALGGQVDPNTQEAQSLARFLPVMIKQADADGATPAFKQFVHQLIQSLPVR